MADIMTLDQARAYKVRQSGSAEALGWCFYDYATYATAGTTGLQFFQVPVGQSSKTLADTNMTLAGQLPSGQAFLLQSIELVLFPGVNPETATATNQFVNDVYAIMKGGYFLLNIGSKNYLQEAPLGVFPPKANRMQGFSAVHVTDATADLVVEYGAMAGRPYMLKSPLLLESSQNFSASLNWPTAVATPSGQNARIGLRFEGTLYRDVQ